MQAYGPNSVELRKAKIEVYYEIQQLALTATLATNDVRLNNALVESRLLHVRTLIDFFEISSCTKDDVLAIHYGFPQTTISIETAYKERLNKDLAHLTYSRTRRSSADKSWPDHRVIRPVLESCLLFIDHMLSAWASFNQHERVDWENLRKSVADAISSMPELHRA